MYLWFVHFLIFYKVTFVFQNSCGDITIRKWIENNSEGQRLINVLDNEVYTPEDRCLLVRIVMAEVMKICDSA